MLCQPHQTTVIINLSQTIYIKESLMAIAKWLSHWHKKQLLWIRCFKVSNEYKEPVQPNPSGWSGSVFVKVLKYSHERNVVTGHSYTDTHIYIPLPHTLYLQLDYPTPLTLSNIHLSLLNHYTSISNSLYLSFNLISISMSCLSFHLLSPFSLLYYISNSYQ